MAVINPVIIRNISGGWVRPSYWLPRPSIAISEKVVYLLTKVVENDTNYIKLNVSGAFTVDWGDGNIINYNAAAVCEYNINYATVPNFVGDDTTDKQCWVKVTPQGTGVFSVFSVIYLKTTTTPINTTCNQKIVEVLTGKINISVNYSFAFAFMQKLESIIFNEPIIINNNIQYSFKNNYSLENIEGTFESNIYNSTMFSCCYKLQDLSKFVFKSEVTTQLSCFENIGAKEIIQPLFRLGQGKYLIRNCTFLQKTEFDLTSWYFAYQMAYGCYNLDEFVLTNGDGSGVSSFQAAFYNCNFIETPALNLTGSASNSGMFDFNYRLKKSNLTNIKASIGFNYCNLSHAAILEIVTNQLQTVVSAQVLDVGNNPDVLNLPAATIAIATSKNWTVQIS